MVINIIKAVLLIMVAQLFLFGSCNKNGTTPCANRNAYSFLTTSEWIPQKDYYMVGDTIFLQSIFSKTLIDQTNTNLSVDYGNAVAIGGDIGIAYLDTIQKVLRPAKDSFQFFSATGQFVERAFNQHQGINFQ